MHDPIAPFSPMEDILSLQSLGTNAPLEASVTSGCTVTASCGETVGCGLTGSCGETFNCGFTVSCRDTTPAPKLPPSSS